MQQHGKVMFTGNTLHQVHYQLIMIIGKVGILKDWSQFKLVGGNFVMACFCRNSKFVAFYFQFFHESCYPWGDRTEIVVFQLLVFCRRMSHKRAPGQTKIGTGIV